MSDSPQHPPAPRPPDVPRPPALFALTLLIMSCGLSVEGLPPELSGRGGRVVAISDVPDTTDSELGANDDAPDDALADDTPNADTDAGLPDPWEAWAAVLDRYNGDGCFNYEGLTEDPEALGWLDDAVDNFATVDAATLATSAERLAYWYNAYNTFMVKAVIDGYSTYAGATVLLPHQGELVFRHVRWEASGRTLSLNMIEHGILRRDLVRALVEPGPLGDDLLALADDANGDAPFDVRLHFAINCASKGCPRLRREPYVGHRLDEQLEDQTTTFLNDPRHGAGPLGISELLVGLYPEDFEREAGTVAAYVRRYNPDADTTQRIAYNWSLNECD